MPVSMNFGAPPPDLKAIVPYLARATELRKKEPIIAYYCLYYATQVGITIKSTQKECKTFLINLMTSLEGLKDELKDVNEVNSDIAASAYIEAFALKVFNNADAEDRLGGSNRSTAKKFLAAGNFLDLLKIFDNKVTLTVDFEEKARYAKWKAADIAKAFREGRVPQSGPANEDGLSIGDRPVSPPSDFDDLSLSLSSSAIGVPPCVPLEQPSPRKAFEHKLPLAGLPSKAPVRHGGIPDGVWSTVATPGSEIPGGPAPPLPFSLAAVLNASQRDGNPKPRSALKKVAAPEPPEGHGEDTDPEDGDDGWSTVANPFSRQNSVTVAGATPPDSAGAGASFTTNLASLSEEPSPLHSGVAPTSKPVNALNVALPASAASSPNTHSMAIPPSKHQSDPSKQGRFTRDTREARASGHQRNGSSGSAATTTTMVTSGTTLRSPLSKHGNGVPLADYDGTPVKADIAPSSPSETLFGAQLPTPPSTAPKAPVPGQKSPASKKQPSASSEEDEWEQNSVSRIARLPDSQGRDSDGKYTGGGGGDLTNPTRPAGAGNGGSTPIGRSTAQHGTTRSTVREDSSESSASTSGIPRVQLPGVPSSPPVEGWPGQETYRGPPSDDGDLPNLPSAPPVAPSDQENIPHVTVFTKPRPENERHSSSNNTFIQPPYDPHLHSSAPQNTSNPNSWFQGHSRALSQTSIASGATVPASYSQNHPPVPKAPSPPAHFQSPISATSSTVPGYAPPNSVVSPTMSHTGASPNISFHHHLPPPVPGQQYYAPTAPAPYTQQYQQYTADSYSSGWPNAGGHPSTINRSITPQSNGSHPSTGSYFPNGTAYGARTPPETLDPETVAKAQKHAKFAISALNFEDLETARKELRTALEILS